VSRRGPVGGARGPGSESLGLTGRVTTGGRPTTESGVARRRARALHGGAAGPSRRAHRAASPGRRARREGALHARPADVERPAGRAFCQRLRRIRASALRTAEQPRRARVRVCGGAARSADAAERRTDVSGAALRTDLAEGRCGAAPAVPDKLAGVVVHAGEPVLRAGAARQAGPAGLAVGGTRLRRGARLPRRATPWGAEPGEPGHAVPEVGGGHARPLVAPAIEPRVALGRGRATGASRGAGRDTEGRVEAAVEAVRAAEEGAFPGRERLARSADGGRAAEARVAAGRGRAAITVEHARADARTRRGRRDRRSVAVAVADEVVAAGGTSLDQRGAPPHGRVHLDPVCVERPEDRAAALIVIVEGQRIAPEAAVARRPGGPAETPGLTVGDAMALAKGRDPLSFAGTGQGAGICTRKVEVRPDVGDARAALGAVRGARAERQGRAGRGGRAVHASAALGGDVQAAAVGVRDHAVGAPAVCARAAVRIRAGAAVCAATSRTGCPTAATGARARAAATCVTTTAMAGAACRGAARAAR